MAPEKATTKRLKEIAERIMESLEKAEMTQRDLAQKTGMKDSVVSRILHAETNLTLKTIAILEQALGTTLISVP